MVDWTTVISVVLGIFLFNVVFRVLQFLTVVLVGLTSRRQITSPEHEVNPRGSFHG